MAGHNGHSLSREEGKDEGSEVGLGFRCLNQKSGLDVPGGPVVRNLPANAGDTGSMLWEESLLWEDSTCLKATKPMCLNLRARALEPASHSL